MTGSVGAQTPTMTVSIVICTYNRAEGLRQTLHCLRRQRYDNFEVVVVNGPSTDHTEQVLDEIDDVKVVRNPLANLSVSRNLGIRAAAGDIVAFIDDDALPEYDWLAQVLPAFGDPEVGGAGGLVLDHTGMSPQYVYSAANRLGETVFSADLPFDDWSFPGSFTFPYLQGTNALFRRSALASIGLFDETFDFYLDETDVCCRLVDAGYILRQSDRAPVHHKYLPSAVRNSERVVTNWYPVVKNHTYFGYRHALGDRTQLAVIDGARAFIEHFLADTRRHEAAGVLPVGHTDKAVTACADGLAEGIRLGRERHAMPMPPVVLDPDPMLPYRTEDLGDGLRIVLVSSGYAPNLTGGISRFITDVAPQLARLGHDVRVMTKATDAATVDLEHDVWVHRLEPAPTPGLVPEADPAVDRFATSVVDELERISAWWSPDIAYGSLWDVELLGILRSGSTPVVPMLATPVAEVAVHEGWDQPSFAGHVQIRQLIELERELIGGATTVHAISESIVTTFDTLYPGAMDSTRVAVAHIGRADESGHATAPDEPPIVLFVGRLEPRKGIDVLLSAIPSIIAAHDNTRIVIAGADRQPPPGQLSTTQLWLSEHPGLTNVEFVGPVDDSALIELMARSSIVVMPSRYESFGLVVAEAMMHSRAAIASDVGGIRELIDSGRTGLLVPVGDATALARAVNSLLADPERMNEIARSGRRHFETHLTVPSAAQRLDTLLRSAVETSRPMAHSELAT
jgi:hypothetical protein